MAYVDDLLTAYKNANGGVSANSATSLAISSYASQVTLGNDTPDGALAKTLALTSNTTAVVMATYQFFTGAAPSEAGLTFFLNSPTNTNDLNDATGAYANFNQESRFINLSINLALGSSSAASFAAAYSGVSVAQTVSTAYNAIIGNSVAAAAGVDVAAATAWLSRQANIDALTQFVKSNNPTFTAAQIDLAVKAALIGEILNIAISNNLGGYATAVNAAIKDYSDDGHLVANSDAGVNLFVAYPPTASAGETKVLTNVIDTITGTSGADTYTGTVDTSGVVVNNTTLNPLDSINGAGGNDTLNINAVTGLSSSSLNGVTLTSIENINLRSAADATLDTSVWSDVTNVKVTQVVGNLNLDTSDTTAVSVSGVTGQVEVDGSASVTVASSSTSDIYVGNSTEIVGAITITDSNAGNNTIYAFGGGDISITTQKASNGYIDTASDTGSVTINTAAGAYTGSSTYGTEVEVEGGTVITVNQAGYSSTAFAATYTNNTGALFETGYVDVYANDVTTTVTVNNVGPVDAVNAEAAVAGKAEVQTVTFTALAAGQSVTVNGLTFTAGKALTAAQVASAFANLSLNTTQGSASASLGTYSGSFNGQTFTTGATSTVDSTHVKVTLTGVVGYAGSDLGTVSFSGTGVTQAQVTDGVDIVDAVTGSAGVQNDSVYIDGNITGADKLTTVSLTGFGNSSNIYSDALTTLNLASSHYASLTVHNTVATTLALGLNGIGYVDALGTKHYNGLDLGTTYTTLNVTTSGASSYVSTSADGVTALTVAGDKSVDFSGSSFAALKTVKVSGSAGVTLNASGSTVTSFDASATSGKNTVSIDASKATYTGGTGSDTLTVTSTTISKAIALGAGDDKVTLASGTTLPTATISGGDGTDTLAFANTSDAATLSASTAFAAQIDGFEKLQLASVAAGTQATVNLANLDNIGYVISANTGSTVTAPAAATVVETQGSSTTPTTETADVAFSGLAIGQSYTVQGRTVTATAAASAAQVATAFATGTSTAFVTVTGTLTDWTAAAGSSGHTVFTSTTANVNVQDLVVTTSAASGLTLTHFAAAGTLELTAGGSGVTVTLDDATGTADVFNLVLKNAASTSFGTVAVGGVETVNITATDLTTASVDTHSVSITDSALKAITVTGNANLVLSSSSTVLTTVDASALTGYLSFGTSVTGGATVTGGVGSDYLTANGNNDKLIGGAGADTLTANANLVSLTGGAGNDLFNVAHATTNVNSYATITDASAGDLIQFANAGTETFSAAKIALGDTAGLQDYANAAIAGTAVGTISWFTYANNTYIVEHVDATAQTTFTNGTDVIVKLAGTSVDLSTASLSYDASLNPILGIH